MKLQVQVEVEEEKGTRCKEGSKASTPEQWQRLRFNNKQDLLPAGRGGD